MLTGLKLSPAPAVVNVAAVAGYISSNMNMNMNMNMMMISSRNSKINVAALAGGGFVAAAAAVVLVIASTSTAGGIEEPETLSNIPQELSSQCLSDNVNASDVDCNNTSNKRMRIQKPKSKKAESCTVKCLNTCIRLDEGQGPLNIRRPLVVFKSGFRSRQYCLAECSDICNLIGDGDDGP